MQDIKQLLYKYPTCPPSAYVYIKEFFNNDNINHISNNSDIAKVVIRNWCAELNNWALNDFAKYYTNPSVKPYFNVYNTTQTDVYYDVPTSIEIASRLLLYQYGGSPENVHYFLTDVLNVIDMRINKLNTIAIHAEPNAGKNYFFDPIAAFFINHGCIGSCSKPDKFDIREAVSKRIVLWNEPKYEACHVNKLKELLGGETTRIHVKYKGDVTLQCPPIIILTNKILSIFGMEAFKSRIKIHRWRAAPFLREYDKKINPLFLPGLFDKYNVYTHTIQSVP